MPDETDIPIPSPAAASRLIRRRRSIKPALMDADRAVPAELLRGLFEDATWAPTHGMTEPWHFVVFAGDARQRLAENLQTLYREVTPEAAFRPEKYEKLGRNPLLAHVVAAICMRRPAPEKIPETEEIAAVACAVQNLHLLSLIHI